MHQTTALIQIKYKKYKILYIGSLDGLISEIYKNFGRVEFKLIKTKTVRIIK